MEITKKEIIEEIRAENYADFIGRTSIINCCLIKTFEGTEVLVSKEVAQKLKVGDVIEVTISF